jgi:dTDP-4-amino-4,6-dideoxygalactose transaminase
MAELRDLEAQGVVRLPVIDVQGTCNGHIMYIITASLDERTRLIGYLLDRGIKAVFHYVPLHSSPMGEKHCRVHGVLTHTDEISERLLRLPLYYEMTDDEVGRVVEAVKGFYK